MPVRKIRKNYLFTTGIVSTKKSIGDAEWEGTLEPDLYKILAFDPRVLNLEVQPLRVPWLDSIGKGRLYTPDCHVNFVLNLRSVTFEVKSRSWLREHWKEVRTAYRAAVHVAALKGERFKLITDVEIRIPYLQNVKILLPIVRRGADRAQQARLLAAIAALGDTTPSSVLQYLCVDAQEWGFLLHVLWYLVGTFQVYANLTVPLTMESLICPITKITSQGLSSSLTNAPFTVREWYSSQGLRTSLPPWLKSLKVAKSRP